MPSVNDLLQKLWSGYAALNPQAHAIHQLLGRKGETVVNDHIALRTFNDPRVRIDVLARTFVAGGYQARGTYSFAAKKLNAQHFEPKDPAWPKVFISELRVQDFSPALQATVRTLIDQMPADVPARWDFAAAGRPWELAFDTYEALRKESEYAAWLAAFGFRANHFTVLVNALEQFADLAALNAFLKEHGCALHAVGGEIKGSPAEHLEQSSTLADEVAVSFTDGPRRIPGCYYEFAQRYRLPDGKLFAGFVARSADKIFQSTDHR